MCLYIYIYPIWVYDAARTIGIYSHVFDCRTVSAVDFDYNSRAVYVIGTEPLFSSLQYYTVSVILYSGAITHYIIISVIYAVAAIIIKKNRRNQPTCFLITNRSSARIPL